MASFIINNYNNHYNNLWYKSSHNNVVKSNFANVKLEKHCLFCYTHFVSIALLQYTKSYLIYDTIPLFHNTVYNSKAV